MPQVWHDGTSEHRVRDMDLEDTVVRNGGGEEEKGCLELIFWLLLPTIIAISEVIYG